MNRHTIDFLALDVAVDLNDLIVLALIYWSELKYLKQVIS